MMVKRSEDWCPLLLLLLLTCPAHTQGGGAGGVRLLKAGPVVLETPAAVVEMTELLLATTSVLEIRHLVLVTPDTFGVGRMLEGVWAAGMTTEVHLDTQGSGQPWGSSSSSREGGPLWSRVDWSFLYGRGPWLHRRQMALLVTGPAPWALTAAIQWDTLLVAAVGEVVEGGQLCPHVPLGGRVALLHQQQPRGRCRGIVQEAQLEDGGRYVLRSVGCWARGRLVLRQPLLQPLASLRGATLKTVIVQGFNEVVPQYEGQKLVLGGELGQFLTKIRRNLNFSLEIGYVQGFGVKEKNGSFNGVVGVLERREADFASASLSVLRARAQVLDFSRWFGLHNTRFLTKMPTLLDDQFLIFQIYHWQAWCMIVGFLALASTVLVLTWRPAEHSDTWTNSHTRYTALTTTLKTAVYMASVRQPKNTSGRVVLVWTWAVVIVLVSAYRGSLTSFLSIPRVARPPETIRQLLDMGYTLSISRGYSQYAKMKTSPVPDHQEAFQRAEFRQDRGILPEDHYIQQAKTQPTALLVMVLAVTILMDKYSDNIGPVKVCSLKSSSEALFLEIGALGFPRNSPIKALFDHQIRWIVDRALKEMPKESCVAPQLQADTSEALGMATLGGLLVLWAVGVSVAIILFLGEVLAPCTAT